MPVRRAPRPIADADIPQAIARDTEFAAADAAHAAALDPHLNFWTRITNTFLALTGGRILKNNPAPSAISYDASQNHLELVTNNGSNPILGFHRAGFSATALYHLGYGNDSLRIRNADGFDGAIVHDGNIGSKIAGTARTVLVDDNLTVIKQKLITGTTPATPGLSSATVLGINPNLLLGFCCMVGIDQGNGAILWAAPPGVPVPGYAFSASIFVDIFRVRPDLTNSANILNRPFKALIYYIG